jgi:ketosteroid isomerase-like protein
MAIENREKDKGSGTLEQKVQMLLDIEEIRQLHHNYTYWLCNKQFKEMLDCFVDDAVADISGNIFRGKAAISGFFTNVVGQHLKATDGHIAAQPVITVKGDTAHGAWLLFLTYAEPAMHYAQGRQEVDYVKVNGHWKIQFMKFIRPWPQA